MKLIKRGEGECPDQVHGGKYLWRCQGHLPVPPNRNNQPPPPRFCFRVALPHPAGEANRAPQDVSS